MSASLLLVSLFSFILKSFFEMSQRYYVLNLTAQMVSSSAFSGITGITSCKQLQSLCVRSSTVPRVSELQSNPGQSAGRSMHFIIESNSHLFHFSRTSDLHILISGAHYRTDLVTFFNCSLNFINFTTFEAYIYPFFSSLPSPS